MIMKSVFSDTPREPTHPAAPRSPVLGALVAGVLLVACGAEEDDSLPVCDAQLCTVDDRDDSGDMVQTTVVHAPDEDAPIYFSFAAPGAALTAEEIDAGAWDLSFARTVIKTNGGASGEGGVEVTWVADADITDAGEPPTDGWVSDGADEDSLAFSQGDGWYRYDLLKHIVDPRARLYYVRATDGVTYAVQMVSYYDHSGDSRFPTFDWIAVDG
jgi:hypothetical protein